MNLSIQTPRPPTPHRAAIPEANMICEESATQCRQIGEHGLSIIQEIARKKGMVNILTHCNAGWLACVDYGTATSPIYAAAEKGIRIHVWVDETRPRNQGYLTAWELGQQGISHTLIADNTGGHLMQKGMVDMCIVGSDRTTLDGDVTNKIGTYLKALAAKDNDIPFYVALPASTFDHHMSSKEIPIEERDPDELNFVSGVDDTRKIRRIRVTPDSPVANYAFDITPSRLVTALITDRGICRPERKDILSIFNEGNDGAIKFRCKWKRCENRRDISRIDFWRQKLFDSGLIGAYEDGTGYGNISLKLDRGFLITGSGTGGLSRLDKENYSHVTEWDFDRNFLRCEGPVKASSESLTHAAVYMADPSANAVIHIHNLALWERLKDKVPAVKSEYGTPELAKEIAGMAKKDLVQKIIVMLGHEEGIIVFGKDLDDAGKELEKYF